MSGMDQPENRVVVGEEIGEKGVLSKTNQVGQVIVEGLQYLVAGVSPVQMPGDLLADPAIQFHVKLVKGGGFAHREPERGRLHLVFVENLVGAGKKVLMLWNQLIEQALHVGQT